MKNLLVLALLGLIIWAVSQQDAQPTSPAAQTAVSATTVAQPAAPAGSQASQSWECGRGGTIVSTLTPNDQIVWKNTHGASAETTWRTQGKCDGAVVVQPTVTPFRVKPVWVDKDGTSTQTQQPITLFTYLNDLGGGYVAGAWLEPKSQVGEGLGDDIAQFELDCAQNPKHSVVVVAYIAKKQAYVASAPFGCALLYDPKTLNALAAWVFEQNR